QEKRGVNRRVEGGEKREASRSARGTLLPLTRAGVVEVCRLAGVIAGRCVWTVAERRRRRGAARSRRGCFRVVLVLLVPGEECSPQMDAGQGPLKTAVPINAQSATVRKTTPVLPGARSACWPMSRAASRTACNSLGPDGWTRRLQSLMPWPSRGQAGGTG